MRWSRAEARRVSQCAAGGPFVVEKTPLEGWNCRRYDLLNSKNLVKSDDFAKYAVINCAWLVGALIFHCILALKFWSSGFAGTTDGPLNWPFPRFFCIWIEFARDPRVGCYSNSLYKMTLTWSYCTSVTWKPMRI